MQKGKRKVMDPLQAFPLSAHRNPFITQGDTLNLNSNLETLLLMLLSFPGQSSEVERSSIWASATICSTQKSPGSHR